MWKRLARVGMCISMTALCAGTAFAQSPQEIERRRLELLQKGLLAGEGFEAALRRRDAMARANALLEAIKADPIGYRKTGLSGAEQPAGGFLVTLVLGDLKEAAMPSNLSNESRKALEDMKGFLPYKSYQFLDAVTLPPPPGESPAARLLRGNDRQVFQFTDQQVYQLQLAASRVTPSSLRLTVALVEAPASTVGGQDNLVRGFATRLDQIAKELAAGDMSRWADLKVEERALKLESDALWRTLDPYEVDVARRTAVRPVVSTGFTMDVGETVVVGTSRVNGERALILLVTAVR